MQDLQEALTNAAKASELPTQVLGAPRRSGPIFILRGDLLGPEARDALLGASRAVLVGRRGTLAEQLKRLATVRTPPVPQARARRPTEFGRGPEADRLAFFNGYGGFDRAEREYVTVLRDGAHTPAPWINVIANPVFGFQAAADGAGYTWSLNSRENQITPWSNDPVVNRWAKPSTFVTPKLAELWVPTAQPFRAPPKAGLMPRIPHGFGYSRFRHAAAGIDSELVQFILDDDAIQDAPRLLLTNAQRPSPASVSHLLLRLGARSVPGRRRAFHQNRALRRNQCAAGSKPVESRLSVSRSISRSRRPTEFVDRRPQRVSRTPRTGR